MRITIFLLIACSAIAFSQNYKREVSPFQISDGAVNYKNPFSGGANNIETQFIDIDGDSDFDLFFLDSDGSYGWYKNKGNATQYEFELSIDTIQGLSFSGWFYFADYDGDGDKDYFTSGSDNFIRIRKNTGGIFSPRFETVTDTLRGIDGNIIFSESGSNPVFVDVDNDGDYDFISGNSTGTLNFYENTGSPQNLRLKFITDSWQGILIISNNNENLHGASSLEFADLDSDDDPDMLWGDFFSKSLYYIENAGTPDSSAYFVKYAVYPRNSDSIITSGFNMPRLCDIDNDGDKDLFVSVLYDPTVSPTLMFFRNEGSNQNPDLRIVTKDFLNSFDAGVSSYPALADLNGDGKEDIIVGHGKGVAGKLLYLRNAGTGNSNFFIADTNLFSQIAADLVAAPCFADLDSDGDTDLILGNFDGTLGYFKNSGTINNPLFQYSAPLRDAAGVMIDAGLYSAPHLRDIDSDGDCDLVLGGFNGKVTLYRNQGDGLSYSFTKDETYFAGIDAGDNSAPYLSDGDDDGKPELYSGSRSGGVQKFVNNGSVQAPSWMFVKDILTATNPSGNTVPLLTDIDGDTDHDLILGNVKGGLMFFRNLDINSAIMESVTFREPELKIYPNPGKKYLNIRGNSSIPGAEVNLKIFSISGELVHSAKIFADNSGIFAYIWGGEGISKEKFSSGIFIITAQSGKTFQTSKVTILK